jgi:hypothetical protein
MILRPRKGLPGKNAHRKSSVKEFRVTVPRLSDENGVVCWESYNAGWGQVDHHQRYGLLPSRC